METITGIENLKDEFRRAKLKVGDLRGLSNRFALAERLGVNQLQVYFSSAGGNGHERMEVYAEVLPERKGKFTGSGWWCYSMKELVADILSDEATRFEISINYCKWNKARTDAERITIKEDFLFIKHSRSR